MEIDMWIRIAAVVVLLLIVLVVFIATRPADFKLSRSRTLSAPANVIWASVNDFHQWPAWSPWEKIDPELKREYSGPPEGTGSSYFWSSENAKAGVGRMTITDAQPSQSVSIRLEFIKPFTATNSVKFEFVPSASGTNVTWSMTGRRNFMMKAFCIFMNMKKMVGPDFERGLANLDAATAASHPPAKVALN
jgi:hypothetical protein